MKKNHVKKVLLSVCGFLAVSCMTIGGVSLSSVQTADALEQTEIKTAVESYTSVLPEGVYLNDYTVLDLGAKSIAANAHDQYDMGTHQAVRFQYNKIDKPWGLNLGVYNDTNGYHQPYNSGFFNLWNGNGNTLTYTIFGKTVTGSMPSWMERADLGDYDIEYGGVKCYSGSGSYAGEYYYLEVDGCIISEYFHESNNPNAITTNLFTISPTGAISISPYGKGKDISENVYVEMPEATYAGINPIPTVYQVVEKENKNYVTVVDDKYYDVAYAEDAATKTGVATVTFKDKYSGTATANYTFKEVKEYGALSAGARFEDCAVKEILETDNYKTPTVIANPLNGYKVVGNGENIFRAKIKNENSNGNLIISAKARTLYDAYFYASVGLGGGSWNDANRGYIKFYERKADLQTKIENPSWLNWKDGVDVEMGVIKLVNSDNALCGVYYYLELNGVRVFEGTSYQVSDINAYNMGNDFMVGINGSIIELAPFGKLTVNDTDSRVEIQDNALQFDEEGNVKVKPVLKYTRIIGTNASCSPVTENDYDIEYSLDKESGKCTITATLKGKFNAKTITKVVDYTQDEKVKHTVTLQDASGAVIDTQLVVEGETFVFPEGQAGVSDLIGWNYENALYAPLTEVTVQGDITIKAVCLEVNLIAGASVRISNSDGYYGGMRFVIEVNTAQLAELGDKVSLHGLLIPTDLIDGEYNINEVGVQDNVLKNGVDEQGITTYYITLTDIYYQNFNRAYSAKAYASVTYADGSILNFETEYTKENNARAPYEVAVMAHNDTAKYNEYSQAQKDILDSYIQYTVQLNDGYEIADSVVIAAYTVVKEGETLQITFANIPESFKAYNKIPVTIWKNGVATRFVYDCTWSGNVATVSI